MTHLAEFEFERTPQTPASLKELIHLELLNYHPEIVDDPRYAAQHDPELDNIITSV